MLEIRNICKTYRAKSGVEVKALDNVSLTFPDHGMIFLLGKSGSGKSTLLNVIGGLDTYDSGELIIRGRSSATFRRSDFDSYRNTFIGFIFQEYNILDDFSVGANIALALELQGKRATEEAVNAILEEVDLAGFGNRKPNELSGGQKQRIAIARALIKSPQIIMADEPTGALDSATGEQVLETLKKLSAEKLVIVVSHDRDFAETYGDRIIELADGQVISDTTITDGATAAPVPDRGMTILSDAQISIVDGYVLTNEDLAAINAYLASHKNDVTIKRTKVGITTPGTGGRTRIPTGHVETKTYDKNDAKFIRSRLPMRKAAKMGLSSIRSKPIRLMFTILLSLVAFSLFGYSATAIFYNKTDAATGSIRDMKENVVVMTMLLKQTSNTYDELGVLEGTDVGYYNSDALNDEDIAELERLTGVRFFPVYNGFDSSYNGIGIGHYIYDESKLSNPLFGNAFITDATGVTDISREDLTTLGFTLREDIPGSRMPTAPGEIAISDYYYTMFHVGGFRTAEGKSESSPIGQSMIFNFGRDETVLTIVGVIDTGLDLETEYPALLWDATPDGTYSGKDVMKMREKLESEVDNSFHTMLMAAPGTLDTLPKLSSGSTKEWGMHLNSNLNVGAYRMEGDKNNLYTWYLSRAVGNEQSAAFDIAWADQNRTGTMLENDDFVISADYFFAAYTPGYRWDITPIPALKRHLLDAGYAVEGGSPVSASNHITDKNYSWDESEQKEIIHYTFAQWLGMDDAAYEVLITEALNEAYGLSLSFEEYQGLFGYWTPFLNDLTDRGIFSSFGLYWWREMYRRYPEMESTLLEDADFYHYVTNYYGWDENTYPDIDALITDMITTQQLPAASRRALLSDLAARYLHQKWNEGNRTEKHVLLGYDLNEEYSKYSKTYFQEISDEGRNLTFIQEKYNPNGGSIKNETKRVITGIYFSDEGELQNSDYILSPRYYDLALREEMANSGGYRTEIVNGIHERGKYAMAIGAKPTDAAGISALVDLHLSEEGEFVFRIRSSVMETLDTVNEVIVILDKVFLGVGVFFALFASLMMFNFISASITNKKREIGILRAVGARSRDVFLIFFTEAFFVAVVNFLLSTVATFAGVLTINLIIREKLGFNLTLFAFDLRQILLLLLVSVVVAFISSFLPTNSIARKTPINAMRDR